MPRTGNNIYKREDGRWEGRYPKGYKDNGKIAYGYVYAKTYAEVKEKLKSDSVNFFSVATKRKAIWLEFHA